MNIVKLIKLVRQNPCLYDNRNEFFKKHGMKMEIWINIAKELHSTVLKCKAKWQNLRTTYAREKRKGYSLSDDPDKNSTWKYFKILQFLNNHFEIPGVIKEDIQSTIDDTNSEEEDTQSIMDDISLEKKDNTVFSNTKLIKLVRQHPCLYDNRHELFKKHEMKREIWISIAKELNSKVHKCKAKWQNLCSSYGREKKKGYSLSDDPNKNSTWKYFKILQFLNSRFETPGMIKEDIQSTIDDINLEEEDIQSTIDDINSEEDDIQSTIDDINLEKEEHTVFSNTKLIKLVRQNPCLYDNRNISYRRHELKKKIWIGIAKELNSRVHQCKAKWQNLRSVYLKQKKKGYSLSDDPQKKKCGWKYFKIMQFINCDETPGMIKEDINSIIDDESLEENDNTVDIFDLYKTFAENAMFRSSISKSSKPDENQEVADVFENISGNLIMEVEQNDEEAYAGSGMFRFSRSKSREPDENQESTDVFENISEHLITDIRQNDRIVDNAVTLFCMSLAETINNQKLTNFQFLDLQGKLSHTIKTELQKIK